MVVPPGGGIPAATLIVPRRNHGPIIAIDGAPPTTALSVQYTGWSPTREVDTFRLWLRARDLDDFRDALQFFDVGSQNWSYADRDGNIAYFTSAELPLREDLQLLQAPDGGSRRTSSVTAATRCNMSGWPCRIPSRVRPCRSRSCRSTRCRKSSIRPPTS